jgi:hypothetical protein
MSISTSATTESIKSVTNRLFILQYSELFNKQLANLSDSTKHIIRKNEELNSLYDLFLDFIIDSSQHLDYTAAKILEKVVD